MFDPSLIISIISPLLPFAAPASTALTPFLPWPEYSPPGMAPVLLSQPHTKMGWHSPPDLSLSSNVRAPNDPSDYDPSLFPASVHLQPAGLPQTAGLDLLCKVCWKICLVQGWAVCLYSTPGAAVASGQEQGLCRRRSGGEQGGQEKESTRSREVVRWRWWIPEDCHFYPDLLLDLKMEEEKM